MINTDSPKNKKEDDLLNRHLFAEQIVNGLLTSYPNGSESLIIGINGAWGTGKSTLLNFIKTELKAKDKGVIFDFNPWLFSGQEQLQRKFFKELKETLKNSLEKIIKKAGESKSQLSETLEKPLEIANNLYEQITEYTKSINEEKDINWWKELLKNSGDVIGKFEGETGMFKLAGVVSKMLKDEEIKEKPINEIKEAIDKSLEKLNKKIYIFIDDLDRLSPTEITQIFQLIRLNANFKNTVFFVTFDKEIVVNALQKEYQKNAENYLEKIIQVDYSLPEILPSKIHEILYEKDLKAYLQTIQDINTEQIIADLKNIWEDGFSHYFKNLRDINRYINGLKLRLPSIYKEVDIVDFLILEAIRIFDYQMYEYIYKNKKILTEYVGSKKYNEAVAKDYEKKINEVFVADKFSVGTCYLTEYLFSLHKLKDDSFLNNNSLPEPFAKFSIAVAAYFDRYFTFQLIPTDFSKEEISTFFNESVSQKVKFFEQIITKEQFEDFANLIQKSISDKSKEKQMSILKAYIELGSKYPILYDSYLCSFCSNELINIARLSEGRGKTLFHVLSEHYPHSYLKLCTLAKLYYAIKKSKDEINNHILNNTFLLSDFDESEVQREYANTLLSVGENLFEGIKNNTYEKYNRNEIRWIYYEYYHEYPDSFSIKFADMIKTDAVFLSLILTFVAFTEDHIHFRISEKDLHLPLTKEFIIERVGEIDFAKITDKQQIKTYKFLQKVIENEFKEGVYYH